MCLGFLEIIISIRKQYPDLILITFYVQLKIFDLAQKGGAQVPFALPFPRGLLSKGHECCMCFCGCACTVCTFSQLHLFVNLMQIPLSILDITDPSHDMNGLSIEEV